MPAGAEILPLRSNIPAIAEYVFHRVDPEFPKRAQNWGGGIVVGGVNYGQGSSREHAALAPMYLGLRAVITKSFSRIHHANLVNVGILPLTFADEEDYEALSQGDELEISEIHEALKTGAPLTVHNHTQDETYPVEHGLAERQVQILLAGGLLNYVKEEGGE
jgi:aconitate hydratase